MSEPMNDNDLGIECRIGRDTLEPGTHSSIDVSITISMPKAEDDFVCSPGQIVVVGNLDERWSAPFDLDGAIYRSRLSEPYMQSLMHIMTVPQLREHYRRSRNTSR